MSRQFPLILVAVLLSLTACATFPARIAGLLEGIEGSARAATSPAPRSLSLQARPGTVPLPEVSGAVAIGEDRVLLIADEGYHVLLVQNAASAFASGDFTRQMAPLAPWMDGGKQSKKILDDIEDVAWNPEDHSIYLVTSHSRSKNQDDVPDPKSDKPQRHRLARVQLTADGRVSKTREIDTLTPAFTRVSVLREAMARPHQAGGDTGTFNIEGLAFVPGRRGSADRLLLGLRSPTRPEKGKSGAVVLGLEDPARLFSDSPSVPRLETFLLDLKGEGIRGMTYDNARGGCWIVAGASADPDVPAGPARPSLWFWSPHTPAVPPIRVSGIPTGDLNLEGICLLEREGKPGLLLLSDDGDASKKSRYLQVPLPRLPSQGGKR